MDVFIYYTQLPDDIDEMVTPCFCGYTIYINQNLTYEKKLSAYEHAMHHIRNNDFEKHDVQSIESKAHGRPA